MNHKVFDCITFFDEWLMDRDIGEVQQLFHSVNGAFSTRRRPQGGLANAGSGTKGKKVMHYPF